MMSCVSLYIRSPSYTLGNGDSICIYLPAVPMASFLTQVVHSFPGMLSSSLSLLIKRNFSFLISLQVIQRAIPPLPQPTTQTCIQPAAPATPQVKIYVWRRDRACRTMQEDLTFAAQCAKPNGFHVLVSKPFPGKAPALSSS